jgi:polyhydroxybutyrate depolymerase
MRFATLAAFVFSLMLLPETGAQACGVDTDCVVGKDRHYRIAMPQGHDGTTRIGAIVYAHGYRGSAAAMMKNKSMAKLASDLGVALIATKSYAEDWRIPGVPRNTGTDGALELSYYDAVVEDVTKRFPIDKSRLMATGFSAGGMMVWNLICHRSDLFAGFAPISSTFWEPEPAACDTPPANVIHIHGNADPVVPLMGRPIADTHQGQVPQVLDMYARYGGYKESNRFEDGRLSCQTSSNPSGKMLNFCLFEGGHSFRTEFVGQAWKMFETKGKL